MSTRGRGPMPPPPTDPFSAPVAPEQSSPLTLIGAVNALLRQRWSIVATAVLVAAAVVGVTLLLPRTYTARATFIPQTSSPAAGGLTSVASQLGIEVGGTVNTESPAFYADLMTSREILRGAAESTYTATIDGARASGKLADVLQLQGQTEALRRHRALEYLREHAAAAVTPKTGTVVVTATTPSAALSHQIVAQLLAQVSRFNAERRQSRAAAERRFTEQRLAEARGALSAAERRLEAFLVRNRRFTGSPTLEFERERLAREVSVRSQRYMMISEAHERARIEEIRDQPVITVIEPSEMPVLPDRRMLLLKGAVGLTAGLVLGITLALIRQMLAASQRSRSDEYAEFLALRREAVADLKRPWRPLTSRRTARARAS